MRWDMKEREMEPYRIGWWVHPWWPTARLVKCLVRGRQPDGQRVARHWFLDVIIDRLKLIRRPHRPWQSEAPAFNRHARRAFTAAGAERKMLEDVYYPAFHNGRESPFQCKRTRRSERANG